MSVALDAEFVVQSATRQHLVPAEAFFVTYLTTTLEPDDLLTEIRFPAWPAGWGWDIQEICRREGDFALVDAVSLLQVDGDQRCQAARLVFFGVGGVPVRVRPAEDVLIGQRVEDDVLREVEHRYEIFLPYVAIKHSHTTGLSDMTSHSTPCVAHDSIAPLGKRPVGLRPAVRHVLPGNARGGVV